MAYFKIDALNCSKTKFHCLSLFLTELSQHSSGSKSDTHLVTHYGGCHCGHVRFQVKAPQTVTAIDCKYIFISNQFVHYLTLPNACFLVAVYVQRNRTNIL